MDYDDGTPSTPSQMAKDVVEFLYWTAIQSYDERKQMFIRVIGISIILLASVSYYMRYIWSHMRSKQIAYVPKGKY